MPVTEILDLPYIGSKHESRCYDLYVPIAVDPNLPLLFFTHGGAWISGNRQQYKPVGIALAKRGFVTAVAGYQITKKGDPEHITFPVHYRDVADGLTTVHETVKNHISVQPPSVILIGHSAGSHLNGLIALQNDWLKESTLKWISHLINIESIFSIEDVSKMYPTYDDWFFNMVFPDKTMWPTLSLQMYHSTISQTIIHSPDDELLDESLSSTYFKKLEDKGCTVEYWNSIKGKHDQVLEDDALWNKVCQVCLNKATTKK